MSHFTTTAAEQIFVIDSMRVWQMLSMSNDVFIDDLFWILDRAGDLIFYLNERLMPVLCTSRFLESAH